MKLELSLKNLIVRLLGFLPQQKLKQTSLCILGAALLSSCQTAPKKTSDTIQKQGIWTAKILLKQRNKKSYTMNAHVKISEDEKSRIDLTLPSGFYLAGLVSETDKFEMVVPRDKKIYRGRDGKQALKENFGVSLSPRILTNVFTNKPIADKNWSCAESEKAFTCRNLRTKVKISWLGQSGQTRKVNIRSRNVIAKLLIRSKDKNPSFKERDFKLKTPQSFEVIDLDL